MLLFGPFPRPPVRGRSPPDPVGTPKGRGRMFFSALVVHLFLKRLAFDVGNAYGWGKQEKKLALDYLRNLEQYDSQGRKLYMCLHKNTYDVHLGTRESLAD